MRQVLRVATREPHDVGNERPLVLVEVMLPAGTVAADALNYAEEDQQRLRVVHAVLPAETLQAAQPRHKIVEIVVYDSEEVAVVDSRLRLLRAPALATGTWSLMSCSASALISLYGLLYPSVFPYPSLHLAGHADRDVDAPGPPIDLAGHGLRGVLLPRPAADAVRLRALPALLDERPRHERPHLPQRPDSRVDLTLHGVDRLRHSHLLSPCLLKKYRGMINVNNI